jgi:hypothetical protein
LVRHSGELQAEAASGHYVPDYRFGSKLPFSDKKFDFRGRSHRS